MTMTLEEKLDMGAAEIRKMRLTGNRDIGQLAGIESTLNQVIEESQDDSTTCVMAIQTLEMIQKAKWDGVRRVVVTQ